MHLNYHTRSYDNDSIKIMGGVFRGGPVSQGAIDVLVDTLFEVHIRESGVPVFVDSIGREVRLYVSVTPGDTNLGKAVISEYRKAEETKSALQATLEEKREHEIEELMSGLSHEELVRRLTRKD